MTHILFAGYYSWITQVLVANFFMHRSRVFWRVSRGHLRKLVVDDDGQEFFKSFSRYYYLSPTPFSMGKPLHKISLLMTEWGRCFFFFLTVHHLLSWGAINHFSPLFCCCGLFIIGVACLSLLIQPFVRKVGFLTQPKKKVVGALLVKQFQIAITKRKTGGRNTIATVATSCMKKFYTLHNTRSYPLFKGKQCYVYITFAFLFFCRGPREDRKTCGYRGESIKT